MVGQDSEAVVAMIGQLADMCREKKIIEVELGGICFQDERGFAGSVDKVRIQMHELALKAPAVPQSEQSRPGQSNSPASSKATENNLRFGSGSR